MIVSPFFINVVFLLGLSANALICFFFIFRDLVSGKSSYFVSYVFLFLLLSYVLNPFFVYFFEFGMTPHQNDVSSLRPVMVVVNFIVMLFLVSSMIGFSLSFSRKYVEFYFVRFKWFFIVALFFIVLFAFCFFVISYGGLDYVLNNISRIRSGTDENKNYLGAFVRLFTYYIEFLVFFFYVRFYKYRTFLSFFLFLLILSFGIAKAVLDGGRGGLINLFVGILFFSIYLKGGRLPVLYLFFIFLISLVVGIYGKLYIFQAVGSESIVMPELSYLEKIDKVLMEYAHQYYSLVIAVNQGLGADRLFQDLYVWLLKPLILFGFHVPDSISYYNTFTLKGEWDSEVPPGIVAFSYYQGGIFFVPLIGFLFGYLMRYIDALVVNTIRAQRDVTLSFPLLAVISIYLPFAFMNSDPALFVQWVFAYSLLFGIFIFTRNIKFHRLS